MARYGSEAMNILSVCIHYYHVLCIVLLCAYLFIYGVLQVSWHSGLCGLWLLLYLC